MTSPSLPPLPKHVQRLLENEPELHPPAGLENAIWQKLQLQMVPPASSPSPTPPHFLKRAFGSFGLPLAVGAFILGLWGARQVGWTGSQPESAAPIARVASTPEPTPVPFVPVEPTTEETPKPQNEIPAAPLTMRPKRAESSAPKTSVTEQAVDAAPNDDDLSKEQRLLDVARRAIGQKDYAGALGALWQHESLFPEGKLVQEREVLAVKALAASGRHREALKRGESFRDRFPNSWLLPVLDGIGE